MSYSYYFVHSLMDICTQLENKFRIILNYRRDTYEVSGLLSRLTGKRATQVIWGLAQ